MRQRKVLTTAYAGPIAAGEFTTWINMASYDFLTVQVAAGTFVSVYGQIGDYASDPSSRPTAEPSLSNAAQLTRSVDATDTVMAAPVGATTGFQGPFPEWIALRADPLTATTISAVGQNRALLS